MPNPSMHTVLRAEMVKKFESVIRQEIANHEKVILAYQQEMQTLRDSVKYTLEQCDSLFRHSEKEINSSALAFKNLIDDISTKLKAHAVSLSDQRMSIISLSQTFHDFMLVCAKKSELDEFKKYIDHYLKHIGLEKDREFENYQTLIKHSLDSLKEELANFKKDMEQKFCQVEEKINEKFSLSKMDKDGVLKVVRVYEKSMFIIEKKIEHIYILIDRINKRGELCHKLD